MTVLSTYDTFAIHSFALNFLDSYNISKVLVKLQCIPINIYVFLYGFGIMLCSYKFSQTQGTDIGSTVLLQGMLQLIISSRAGHKKPGTFCVQT